MNEPTIKPLRTDDAKTGTHTTEMEQPMDQENLITPKRDARAILEKKTFLFDCDGTIYNGSEIIPGSQELIGELRDSGKEIFFFTNNSSRDRERAFLKLKKMGLAEREDEVIMSTDTVITYLKSISVSEIFLLGTQSMGKMLEAEGIKNLAKQENVLAALTSITSYDAAPKSVVTELARQVSRVVVAFDREFTFQKYALAMQLVEAGIPYIQAHPDLFCPTDKGPEPDCGWLSEGIHKITKKAPEIILGKPHPLMIAEVEKRTSAARSEMVIFGDRLHVDVEMGRRNGIDTVFVLTGDSQLSELDDTNTPSFILRSVADLVEQK
jgi:HAD superfamily hydrolase (TIGR01450 family)